MFFADTKRNNKKGFTLVETLVAISVMMAAFTGPLVIAERGLQSAAYAKDQIVATFLAEEGIELIRNLRDNNALAASPSWTSNLGPCTGSSGCTIDVLSASTPLVACPLAGCPVVRYDSTTNLFGTNAAWAVTPFTRSVTVIVLDANQILVQSTVSWRQTVNRQITLKEVMFNVE